MQDAPGVYKHGTGKFQTLIRLNGRLQYFGLYKTEAEAEAANVAARKALHLAGARRTRQGGLALV